MINKTVIKFIKKRFIIMIFKLFQNSKTLRILLLKRIRINEKDKKY